MQTTTLKKGTKTGFTALPNSMIDQLLGLKHSCDTIALAVYLVRHLAGQAGQITLTGEFTQARICLDLGWGATNLQRLKRAATQLVALGVLKISLRDNNTVVYEVDANFTVAKLDGSVSSGNSAHPPEILTAPLENFTSPPERKTSDHTRTRIDKININNLNKQNHLRDVSEKQESKASHKARTDDDDFLSVFKLYTELFKQPVPPSQRARFYTAARESAVTATDIANRLKELARHPLLISEVSSINAVWHYAHLRKSGARFDEKARGLIEDIARASTDSASLERGIKQMLKSSKGGSIDSDLFMKYFATTIAAHLPSESTPVLMPEISDAAPESLEPEENLWPVVSDTAELVESQDDTPTTTQHLVDASSVDAEKMPTISEAAPRGVVTDEKVVQPESHSVTAINREPIVCDIQNEKSDSFRAELEELHAVSSKPAFISRLQVTMGATSVNTAMSISERNTLQTLLELAYVESTQLQLLRRMVATRLGRRRAA